MAVTPGQKGAILQLVQCSSHRTQLFGFVVVNTGMAFLDFLNSVLMVSHYVFE